MPTRSSNPYGFDVGNNEDDHRFLEKDYSIGGGVSMYSREFEHGFGHHEGMDIRHLREPKSKSGSHFGKGPRNWVRSDQIIKEDVCEELCYNPFIDASDIEVSVQDGVVSLKGWVESREERLEALKCVDSIPGVKDIHHELHVRNRKLA